MGYVDEMRERRAKDYEAREKAAKPRKLIRRGATKPVALPQAVVPTTIPGQPESRSGGTSAATGLRVPVVPSDRQLRTSHGRSNSMKFALQDILPNPFRRIGEYPIHPEKVRVLRESLRTTGFWDNLVARRNGDGTVEIAYGHHRLEALRQEYGPDHEIPLTIRPLDDNMMLKIMARENQEEWGTSAWVLMETVRALVLAYADGKITLEASDPKTSQHHLRFAPSFIQRDALYSSREHPYTAPALAAFLGWWQDEDQGIPSYSLRVAVDALALIEEGIVREGAFADLSVTQARAVVEQARHARKAAEAERREAEKRARKAEKEAKRAKTAQERHAAEKRARDAKATARAAEKAAKREAKKAAAEVSAGIRQGKSVTEVHRERQAADRRERNVRRTSRPRFANEPASVRKLIDLLRNKTIPSLRRLGDAVEPKMSPEAGRFIAGLYRQAADVLVKKAERYEQKFEVVS